MRLLTRDNERRDEEAMRCLAHGIAHGRATLGDRRLATILGTIALDLAASAEATTCLVPKRYPETTIFDVVNHRRSSLN